MTADHHDSPSARSEGSDVPFVDPLGIESLVALRAEVAHLGAAIVGRAPIEQAKGMLMLSCRVPEQRASAMLEQWSKEWDVDVRTVAITMVRTAATQAAEARPPAPQPGG